MDTQRRATPGPWRACGELGYKTNAYYITGCDDAGKELTLGKGAVAHVPRSTVMPMRANALLLAAAPELLAALKQAVAWMDGEKTAVDALVYARAAIAKAEGGAA